MSGIHRSKFFRSRFAIRISNVGRDTLPSFLEGGTGLAKLRETVRLIIREPVDYDVEATAAAEVGRRIGPIEELA